MHRPYQFISSPNHTNQTDSKMKSKWETPNKTYHTKPHTTSKKNNERKHESSSKQNYQEDNRCRNEELEMQMLGKVKQFQVVSRTLKQYFKSEQKIKNSNTESIELAIKMIRAFSKTQMKKISPSLNIMIEQMLGTLPVSHKKMKKGTAYQAREKNHQREFSFANKQYKMIQNSWSQQLVKQEIRQLANNLKQLKEEKQVMIDICEQFSGMTKQQKIEYIQELEQIMEQQRRVMRQIQEKI